MERTVGSDLELTRGELHAFRLLAAVAAALFSGFGVLHGLVDPARVDPPLERLAATALALLLLGLTFIGPASRVRLWFQVGFAAATLWIVRLVWLNDFSPDYAMSLLIAVPAIAVTYRSLGRLVAYLAMVNAAVILVALGAHAPQLSPGVVVADVAGISAISFIVVFWSVNTEQKLAASQERYELAARGASDGLWDWDLTTGAIYYSPRWKSMLGYREEEVGATVEDWLRRVHPEDVEALRSAMQAHVSGAAPQLQHEYRIRDGEGGWRWMLARGVAVRDDDGKATRMAGSQTDIGAWKQAEARLLHDAFHDPLTDLPNRALFLDRLSRVSQSGRRRASHRYAVLFLDLDRFKVINDGLGHVVGDELLKMVAHRLLLCVRQEDTVARLGGDEFGILLADVHDLEDATRVARRVNAALQQPVRIGEHEVFTSASIGVSLSTAGSAQPEDVIRDADTAMYRAKAAGGMRHEVEGGAMPTEAVGRLRLESELRHAGERGELRVQYQPIVELEGGRVVGLEALLRWQHPQRGLLMPDDFLPLAEETGIVLALDWWVFRRVCEQTARWAPALRGRVTDERGDATGAATTTVSVNMSGRHFWQEDMAQRLDRVLAETGARPEHLRLEIRESAVLRDGEAAARILTEVRGRGIRLVIDDFGTGYSSLTYLQRIPVEALKIDRAFVARVTEDARSAELVRSILGLARTFGLDAVAEGVETAEQLRELERLGCGLAQGFLFSEPLDADAAGALLGLAAASAPPAA